MEQLVSMTGKSANIFVFDSQVIYQKFNLTEVAAPYAHIQFVMYRPIMFGKTGFVKVRSPGGSFDFVVANLSVLLEHPDGPSNRLLWEVFSKIQEMRVRFQGYPGPKGFPADQIFPDDNGYPPLPECFARPGV
jgi:hypothetical protein